MYFPLFDGNARLAFPHALVLTADICPSEEEEDDDEEDSEEESGEIMLQSSSLKVDDEEKCDMEPPAKQPRTSLNLHHALTQAHGASP